VKSAEKRHTIDRVFGANFGLSRCFSVEIVPRAVITLFGKNGLFQHENANPLVFNEGETMRRALLLLMGICATAYYSAPASAQTKKSAKDPYVVKLPIPEYEIMCDLTAWKMDFIVQKTTYDEENKEIVFLLKSRRAFTFTDDGFLAPLRFLDEDGVNMIKDKNLRFDPEPIKLKAGEVTRCYLSLPDEDILKKTKKARAILMGIFKK
jgi:hypothetical protein